MQISVRRAQDANINWHHTIMSQANHFPLLKDTEQSSLKAEWDFGYFIQKNCAVMGKLKEHGFPFRRAPVKTPSTYPKSSLSRSVSGKAAQFTATNAAAASMPCAVDALGEQLLSYACFPMDNHRRIYSCVLPCDLYYFHQRGTVSPDIAEVELGRVPLTVNFAADPFFH